MLPSAGALSVGCLARRSVRLFPSPSTSNPPSSRYKSSFKFTSQLHVVSCAYNDEDILKKCGMLFNVHISKHFLIYICIKTFTLLIYI